MLEPEFVLNEPARERLLARFGDGARAWCAGLPELVARCCARWRLDLDEARSGSTSRVFFGRQGGRREVVLKLTPDPEIARQEACALRAWAGSPHAVGLLDADLDVGALLLARLRPGTKLNDAARGPSAEEMAGLLTGLRVSAAASIQELPPLSERIGFIFGLIGRRRTSPRVAPLVSPELIDRSDQLARSLARPDRAVPAGLVHGDLHFANILVAGSPCRLVAIDPRPSVGDPTFDAVDWVLAPRARDQLEPRVAELGRLIPGLDPDRLWAWCQASAVIIAVQHLYRRPADQTIPFLLDLAAQ
ncbi:MAG: phosphotransferase [Actinobacteria bacterium]|nr:phosphotransferase [Actinomycetota bacterium]